MSLTQKPLLSVLTAVACSGLALTAASATSTAATTTAAPAAVAPSATPAVAGAASPGDLEVQASIQHSTTTAGVTTAAGGWNRCPTGTTCLFSAGNGQGAMAWFRSGSPNLGAQGFDNRTRSTWKRAPGTWEFWTEPNYRGFAYVFSANPTNYGAVSMSSLKRV